jgi:hypothetical protein
VTPLEDKIESRHFYTTEAESQAVQNTLTEHDFQGNSHQMAVTVMETIDGSLYYNLLANTDIKMKMVTV